MSYLSRDDNSLEPIKSYHPFWSSTTGSILELKLIKPPESLINSMKIIVSSICQPFVYKIIVIQDNVAIPSPVYVKKKDAIKIIKNDWWEYYGLRTQVIFKEHVNIDISKLAAYKDNETNYDSPRSPVFSKNNSPRSSSSENNSPRSPVFYRNNSPHSKNSENNSPRSPIFSPRRFSNSPSPTQSPRSARKSSNLMTKLSLSNIQRKNGNYSDNIYSDREYIYSDREYNSESPGSPSPRSPLQKSSPKGKNDSPRTTQLLKRASLKLSSSKNRY